MLWVQFDMKTIKTLLFGLFFSATLLASGTLVSAQFNPLEEACESGTASDSAICKEANRTDNPVTGTSGIIQRVANVLAFVGGVIAVIIIVVAGITMTLSGGDPAKVKSSRDAIIYAAIGLLVVVLARSIVIFVINTV